MDEKFLRKLLWVLCVLAICVISFAFYVQVKAMIIDMSLLGEV